MALDYWELSTRKPTVRFSDERRRSVSDAKAYHLLRSREVISSPAHNVIKAADPFRTKTTRPKEMWSTDFTYFKTIG